MSNFGRRYNNSIHVLSKHFGDGELVFLMDGLTQVNQTAILKRVQKSLADTFILLPLVLKSQTQNCHSKMLQYHCIRVQSSEAFQYFIAFLLSSALVAVQPGILQLCYHPRQLHIYFLYTHAASLQHLHQILLLLMMLLQRFSVENITNSLIS